jgi:hypothetical protein
VRLGNDDESIETKNTFDKTFKIKLESSFTESHGYKKTGLLRLRHASLLRVGIRRNSGEDEKVAWKIQDKRIIIIRVVTGVRPLSQQKRLGLPEGRHSRLVYGYI